jgi:hypothetical protein
MAANFMFMRDLSNVLGRRIRDRNPLTVPES